MNHGSYIRYTLGMTLIPAPKKSRSKFTTVCASLLGAALLTAIPIEAVALSVLQPYPNDPLDVAPSTNADTPFIPASAGSDFTLPYSDALGSGGQSWRGIMSGTMQTTAPCVTYDQATQAGGSATTKGSIAIYKSANEVSHALSVSAGGGYKGVAKVSVSASFNSASSQSSNSIYAVAHVHTNMGMVNLGDQTLKPEIMQLAKNINTYPEALSFLSRCGDSYARGFTQGASWISVMRISSSSSKSSSDIAASISGSYAGFSAHASFNTNASKVSSNSSFTSTEQCNGPLQCGEAGPVNGYSYVDASGCTTSACHLSTFVGNYQYMMKGGLAGACSSTTGTSAGQGGNLQIIDTSAAKCIVAVNYSPIADLAPALLPASAAKRGDLASMDDELVIVPKAPRILVTGSSSALPVENGQATIVVTPNRKGGQADLFRVTATAVGDTVEAGTCDAQNSIIDTPNCTITGLTNGVKYAFVANALNGEGFSKDSNTVYSKPSVLAVNPQVEPVNSASVIAAAANNIATSLDMANALEDTMSPSELIKAAAYGAYGVQRNLANWSAEYQSILSAELENEAYNDDCGAVAGSTSCADLTPARLTLVTQLGPDSAQTFLNHWQDNVRNLGRQATACDRLYISTNPGCFGRATACWISSLDVMSYQNEECSPSAFASNNLLFVSNPYAIADYMQRNKAFTTEILEDATDAQGDRAGLTFVVGSPVIAQGVTVGGRQACSLQQDATVRCWGGNTYGELGIGSTTNSSTPANPGLTGVRQISAGDGYTCAVLQTGSIYCWGLNDSGQLGDGTNSQRNSPTKVVGITNAVSVEAGRYHTCAILADGSVSCWGSNQYNQLGTTVSPGNQFNPYPAKVINAGSEITGVKSLAVGGWHTCVVLGDSNGRCWGHSNDYELGNQSKSYSSGQIMGGADKTMVDSGNRYGCASSSGSLWCWGNNVEGQIGNNSQTNTGTGFSYNLPFKVKNFSASLAQHTCAVTSDSSVLCWGAGSRGQIGDGGTSGRLIPTPVVGLSGPAISVAAGGFLDFNNGQTCALIVGGSVQCWGNNDVGQLGIGNTTQQNRPGQPVKFSSTK